MKHKLTLKTTVSIKVPKEKVWDALINPALIRKYFFGTEAISDWKVGSPIIYRGVWQGKKYMDKGTILEMEPGARMKYNYWSSFSGNADKPENYSNIEYELSEKNGATILNIMQDNFHSPEARTHSEQNWSLVLKNLKDILENE